MRAFSELMNSILVGLILDVFHKFWSIIIRNEERVMGSDFTIILQFLDEWIHLFLTSINQTASLRLFSDDFFLTV